MSTPQMDPDEYFLLTVVREDPAPMQFLADPDRGLGFNLPDPPDLFDEKLVETLARLFERGDIIAQEMRWYRDENGVACSDCVGDPYMPSRSQIECALRHDFLLYYQFTPQGSARWEIAANVNWDNFIWDLGDPVCREREVMATTREAVEHYMTLDFDRDPFPIEHEVCVPDTIRWETLMPWQATYWKTLPIGRRMTCTLQAVEVSAPESFDAAVGQMQTKKINCSHWQHGNRWFRLPDASEPLHPYIDQYRHP